MHQRIGRPGSTTHRPDTETPTPPARHARSPSLLVLTGAGISADSGLPTFRGAGGLWEGSPVEDVATPEAWARDPARVWRFYQARRAALFAAAPLAAPSAAHLALAELERALAAARVASQLVTQNVDDLHERAGSSPLHVHGELGRLRCEGCGARAVDRHSLDPERFVPCARCGHTRLRPDVVWIGEIPHHMEAIGAALLRCTHFVAVGTSGQVWPAAGFLEQARWSGARTWVVALEPPENLSASDEYVEGRAADVVPDLCRKLTAELSG